MPGLQVLVRRMMLVLPILLLAILIGYVIEIWKWLPDRVACHFNLAGAPDDWSSKGTFVAIFLIVESGISAWIYIKMQMHQRCGSFGIEYFLLVLTSYAFWLSLRANVQDAHLPITRVLPGVLYGLVCALLASSRVLAGPAGGPSN